MRRNRDDRTGDGANVKNKRLHTVGDESVLAEQYVSFKPGVQRAESGEAGEHYDQYGRSTESYERVNSAGAESGANPAAADNDDE
jgi:hypothetical protein